MIHMPCLSLAARSQTCASANSTPAAQLYIPRTPFLSVPAHIPTLRLLYSHTMPQDVALMSNECSTGVPAADRAYTMRNASGGATEAKTGDGGEACCASSGGINRIWKRQM